MTMNRWLADESKWAREQEHKVQAAIDALNDPTRIGRMQRAADDAVEDKRHDFRAEMRKLLNDRADLEPDRVAGTIARLERSRDNWHRLAVEESDRLARTEDEPAMFGVEL